MNNGQAYEALIKMQRAGHAEAEQVMNYISELAAALRVAEDNLRLSAAGDTENLAYNAQIIEQMVDRLLLRSPSHGADI